MTFLDTVQIYRCQGCGKWSHAKKQPKKHARWVRMGDAAFDSGKAERATYDYQGSLLQAEGHAIDCGPFTPYIASPGRYRR